MPSLTFFCRTEGCFHAHQVIGPTWPVETKCIECGAVQAISPPDDSDSGEGIATCAVCECAALFVQKDLDQRVGCLILGGGVAVALLLWWKVSVYLFVPTLLAVWILDRFFRRWIPDVVICYRCDAEYRGFPNAAAVRPYDAHVGERYSEGRFERGKL